LVLLGREVVINLKIGGLLILVLRADFPTGHCFGLGFFVLIFAGAGRDACLFVFCVGFGAGFVAHFCFHFEKLPVHTLLVVFGLFGTFGSLFGEKRLKERLSILILPFGLLVLIRKRVTEVQAVLKSFVLRFLNVHLHLYYDPQHIKLRLQTLNLSQVSISKIARLQIYPGPPRHKISNHLHQPLLFQRITDMLVTFHVALD